MNLRCLIVDDEPLAREGLEMLASESGFLEVVASCADALEANRHLTTDKVDLMFLDIHMPRMRGIDFLRSLERRPMVIITSAYPEFALEGFELNVLDYLLKPITPERFLKAVNRAREAMSMKGAYFFIRTGTGYEKIAFDELLFVEAAQNYCALHTPRGKFLTLSTISSMEEQLPADKFLRVQKSFIVALDKVSSIGSAEISIGTQKIPVSKTYRDTLIALVDKKLLNK